MNILGISALYHDSAAALISDGQIVAAAQEERFSRKKADSSIPVNAINYCISQMNGALDAVVYYDNPLLTLDRWISSIVEVSPNSKKLIDKSFESVFGEKLWIHDLIRSAVGSLGAIDELLVCEHHLSHASSAFYPSPFESAAIVTMDGVGEWATTTIGVGKGNDIKILKQINYPHSLGLLYSAFTFFCGFKVNFGEYKLMGLAPYGEPLYYDIIMDKLIRIHEDGSFELNTDYFAFTTENVMTDERFERLFGIKKRIPEERITKEYMDLAASIQKVTEEVVYNVCRHARELTQEKNLVMAGGIALNCVANGHLLRTGMYDNIWIQPAASDAGGALGCALYAYYMYFNNQRHPCPTDSMHGSYLGPDYSDEYIRTFLDSNGYKYNFFENDELFDVIADYLCDDKVIGLFNGRMEYGPRALGNRSIIANPMSTKMQSRLNLKIKYRESFRPFAPSVLVERTSDYFDLDIESPYMLLVAPVKEQIRKDTAYDSKVLIESDYDLIKVVNMNRSIIPAVTHVDFSARVQTVSRDRNSYYYNVIKAFEKKTDCGVIVNTSFNVRGEPIVCSPEDAYLCFLRTDMDVLVLGNYVLLKDNQRPLDNDENWRQQYELD